MAASTRHARLIGGDGAPVLVPWALACRCGAIARMLSGGFAEALDGTVHLPDADAALLGALADFLKDVFRDHDDAAERLAGYKPPLDQSLRLLVLADFLDLPPLVERCAAAVAANVDSVSSFEHLPPELLQRILSAASLEGLYRAELRVTDVDWPALWRAMHERMFGAAGGPSGADPRRQCLEALLQESVSRFVPGTAADAGLSALLKEIGPGLRRFTLKNPLLEPHVLLPLLSSLQRATDLDLSGNQIGAKGAAAVAKALLRRRRAASVTALDVAHSGLTADAMRALAAAMTPPDAPAPTSRRRRSGGPGGGGGPQAPLLAASSSRMRISSAPSAAQLPMLLPAPSQPLHTSPVRPPLPREARGVSAVAEAGELSSDDEEDDEWAVRPSPVRAQLDVSPRFLSSIPQPRRSLGGGGALSVASLHSPRRPRRPNASQGARPSPQRRVRRAEPPPQAQAQPQVVVSMGQSPKAAASPKAKPAAAERRREHIRLRLRGNPMGDVGGKALADLLARSQARLAALDVSHNCLGATGASCLAEAVRWHPTLTELRVAGAALGLGGFRALARALGDNRASLTSVDVSHNVRDRGHPGSDAGEALAAALARNPRLTAVNAAHTSMQPTGHAALAAALRRNATLTALDLSSTQLDGAEAAALADAVARGAPALARLSLARNEFRADCACALFASPSLTELDLSHTELGPDTVAALAGELARNTALRRLGLAAADTLPRAGAVGARDLCRALAANGTLETLDLSNHGVRDRGCADLAAALRHGGLLALNLRNNQISERGALALLEGAPRGVRVDVTAGNSVSERVAGLLGA